MKGDMKDKFLNFIQDHTWGAITLVVMAIGLAAVGTVQAKPAEVEGPFTGCANPANQTQIPESECLALVDLYDSTFGASWGNKTSWKTTNTPCFWYGVHCTSGNVIRIFLAGNNLAGSLPGTLGDLTNLEYLYLENNNLTGSIPVELGNISSLLDLDIRLNNNSLSGSIPAELGNISNLVSINLSNNSLTGSIPAQLGNPPNLYLIDFQNNSLSGSIPAELGNLSNLSFLKLNNNGLTGTIPVELANLTNLLYLYLNNNSLSGSIPTAFGNLSSLERLYLDNNSLTGSIPIELGNLSKLWDLHLHENTLTGNIPTQLGNLTNLNYLYIFNNNITGSIPSALGKLINLFEIDLSGNNLNGGIPPALGGLLSLKQLNLNNNSLSGFVPKELGNLKKLNQINISTNPSLTGWLPSSLTNLSKLTVFSFNGTSLCERPDTAFQGWLANVDSKGTLLSTGVTCNILFTDGFESGNFSAWDAAQVGGGDLVVCAKAAINGAKGMCVKNLTNNTKFVTDSGLSAVAHSAQFNLDPNGLNLQNKKIIRILQAKAGLSPAYWLQIRKIDGKYQLRVMAKLDGGTNVTTAWKRITNNPHLIEVEWGAASGAGNDDGYLKLYIDGRLWRKKPNLDNDTFVVDTVRLGFTNSPKNFTVNGIFFIDDYLSSDSGYIGE